MSIELRRLDSYSHLREGDEIYVLGIREGETYYVQGSYENSLPLKSANPGENPKTSVFTSTNLSKAVILRRKENNELEILAGDIAFSEIINLGRNHQTDQSAQ